VGEILQNAAKAGDAQAYQHLATWGQIMTTIKTA